MIIERAKMGKFTINGQTFNIDGNNICIRDGVVTVDGNKITEVDQVKIQWEGDLASLETDQSVSCGDVDGDVKAGGSVNCDSVGGSVDANGSANCDSVKGDVKAGGSVSCDSVGGNITAGGSVISGK